MSASAAPLPSRLGVVGAGTMGAGIAQLGAAAGIATVIHDSDPAALERGRAGALAGLEKWVEKGRADVDSASRIESADALERLAGCELVIEAAPERPELKRELFTTLSGICGADAVLATNTSSIPVTSLASAAERPERVVGMHFFNPAPLMPLLEVVAADQTGERALALARATGEAMGKQVIVAADGPGFLVNRCGRPFYTEALRLLTERVATHEQIDRICRMGGGFRMGPFELMDMVGIDVGLAVARSFTELSFGEPRWRPSPIQARMVAAGRLGRKTGRGYYDYVDDRPQRAPDPAPSAARSGGGSPVRIVGSGTIAEDLRERASAAGCELVDDGDALVVEAGPGDADLPEPRLIACTATSLLSRGAGWSVGFNLLPPMADAQLVELARLPSTPQEIVARAEAFFGSLGFACEWVEDAPGLVLGRIVAQLVNEACFAVGEGVGSPEDVDVGLELGLNYPRGPMRWGTELGFDLVLAVLDALWAERREERYRAAPLLRRLAAGSA